MQLESNIPNALVVEPKREREKENKTIRTAICHLV